jgi:molybdate transport system substrate-binding protein
MLKCFILLSALSLFFLSVIQTVHAENVRIAAAADLKFALDEIVEAFEATLPSEAIEEQTVVKSAEAKRAKVDVIYGSSGKFHTQIMQGAPYDIFFSADINYTTSLKKRGLVEGEVMPYAIGRIVLWRLKAQHQQALSFASMTRSEIKHIAIANPAHAPYGLRAQEALAYNKLLQQLKHKLVYGENIAQATQFVQTGHANIGILALSLVLSPSLQKVGEYYLIPNTMHTPLIQAFVLTKRARQNTTAKAFLNFMRSQPAQTIMQKYGFTLPR